MSKQSQAREEQGYRHEAPRCGNCRRFTSDSLPIPWMVRMNDEFVSAGRPAPYDMTLPENLKEGNLRCGIGGFAVKKTAYCNRWEDENE